MKCKLSPEDRVAYLYDELEAEDRAAMRVHIDSCPECRAEIEGLTALRRSLPRAEAPPMPGIVRLPEPTLAPAAVLPLRHTTWFRAVMTTAAAILILFFGARVAGLSVTVHDGAMTLRFGSEQASARPTPVETAKAFEVLLAEFKAEQQTLINQMADSMRTRQQRQFDETLAAFGRYLDTRREDDLQLFALGLDEIQRVQDDRYLETNLILSQLINTMNHEFLTMNTR